MRYFGGKECAGTFQRIINLIPPHAVYIEPFLGMGAILRNKRPAAQSIALEINPDVLKQHAAFPVPGADYRHGDALDFLEGYAWTGTEFVYLDPPYLPETRRSRHRYPFELTREDHARLLQIARTIPAPVMLSGYDSALYRRELPDWHLETFDAITRGGRMAQECLWMNYPTPTRLHDYGFLGTDFTDRQRIRRKIARWTKRLADLPDLERAAILDALSPRDGIDTTV